MSFERSLPAKNNTIPSSMPPLPSRRQTRKLIISSTTIKTEIKVQFSSLPHQDDLDDIVNNLSIVAKGSEQLITHDKSSYVSTSIRRTSSLHLANRQENLSNSLVKTSNSHPEQLTDSNLDLSRSSIQRRSLRNAEKFSGIKCSLPASSATVPHTFKGLEKHSTPTKTKSTTTSVPSNDNQITPRMTDGKVKSPWRLRFEKFINHQELTPLSPANDSIAFKTAKTASVNKENRTPSFRLPTRRTSKIHSVTKKDN